MLTIIAGERLNYHLNVVVSFMFQQMHNCFLSFFRQMQSALPIRLCCFGPFFKFCIILFLSVDVFVSYSLSTRYSLFELFWPVSLFSVIR